MATETLNINGVATKGSWTGTDADLNEAIASADDTGLRNQVSEGDGLLVNLDDSALTDGDNISNVSIVARGKRGTNANDSFTVQIYIGGVAQGSPVSFGTLTTSYSNSGTLNDVGWNSDWTAAQLDGMQVEIVPTQGGMPSNVDVYLDCLDVIITTSAAFTLKQAGQRAYLDSAVGADSLVAAAAENANITLDLSGGDAILILRWELEETGGATGSADGSPEYDVNAGGYSALTISTTDVALANGGEACTTADGTSGLGDLLTTSAATFLDAFYENNDGQSNFSFAGSDVGECVQPVKFVAANLNDGDVIKIRASTATNWDNIISITISKGGGGSIAGAVSIGVTPGGTMKEGRSLAGAVTASATPAATMAEGRALAGAQSVGVTPAADMAVGRSIQGGQTVTATPAAAMAEGRVIAGAQSVGVTPGAGMSFTGSASIVGDVTVAETPSAAMAEGRTITGDVPILATIAAGLAEGRVLAGSLSINATPGAAMAEGRAIAGDVPILATVAGAMTEGRVLVGSQSIVVTPAAAMAGPGAGGSIAGNVPIAVTPAAAMVEGRSISGIVPIGAMPASPMAAGWSVAGDVPVLATVAAALTKGQGLAGGLSIDVTPLALLTEGRVIAGAVPVQLSIAASLVFTGTGLVHRAESIMAAVVAAVTGLATTGTNVYRARAYDLKVEELPALAVWQGDDAVLAELIGDAVVARLEVALDAVAREPTAQIDTVLNAIRAEVTAALMADYTLGLPYVEAIMERDAEEPEIVGEGDAPAARLRMNWDVTYHHGRSDPAS